MGSCGPFAALPTTGGIKSPGWQPSAWDAVNSAPRDPVGAPLVLLDLLEADLALLGQLLLIDAGQPAAGADRLADLDHEIGEQLRSTCLCGLMCNKLCNRILRLTT
jgi:hypothetical protein